MSPEEREKVHQNALEAVADWSKHKHCEDSRVIDNILGVACEMSAAWKDYHAALLELPADQVKIGRLYDMLRTAVAQADEILWGKPNVRTK